MNILNGDIEKRIQNEIIKPVLSQKYDLAIRNIPGMQIALHANIPDNKRISYGRFYTIKVLGECLYDQLAAIDAPVLRIGTNLLRNSEDFIVKSVSLGMLSLYGVESHGHFRQVLPHFKSAAAFDHWEVRECAASFFQKLINEYPAEAKEYLLKLVKSDDPNIRRFVSETLRPVNRNQWFYKNPDYPLTILRNLFKESSPYPRTSVGNNLSDLARRLPDLVYDLVEELVNNGDKNSYWIAYRACRNLVKKEPIKVMNLLKVDEYKYKKRIHKRSDY